ncbi:MAG: hypothetical protein D6E12_00490 [Desulfovibrio sp.]|nr:MAG: hypothetical protein D6E12_00490 [Desulfovibrio sp.]
MADTLTLLDEALDLGNQELELLASGMVEEAGEKARERSVLMAEAWDRRDPDKLLELRDKLIRLKTLQGRLTNEAKELHETVRQDLARAKQEGARLAGYGKSVKKVTGYSSFVSKQG